jgi:hypothetical protein
LNGCGQANDFGIAGTDDGTEFFSQANGKCIRIGKPMNGLEPGGGKNVLSRSKWAF